MIEFFKQFAAVLTGHTVTVSVAVTKPVVVEDAVKVKLTDAQVQAKLSEALSDPRYKFRSLNRLTKIVGGVVGADRFYVEEQLASIGARPSRRNPSLFGLTSRVGTRQYA